MKTADFTDNVVAGIYPHTKGFGVGIYVHIPFCGTKCNYCDFVSMAADDTNRIDKYLNTLIKEISLSSSLVPRPSSLVTLYIGGGTPSILSEKQIEFLLEKLFSYLPDDLPDYAGQAGWQAGLPKLESNKIELSFEVNPESITEGKLKILKGFGVNRLSIGLQSVDDEILKFLGRAHRVKDFLKCYETARKTGFDNINVDLIFGIPGQTMKNWQDTLKSVLRQNPEHISTYGLTIEEAGAKLFETGLKKDDDLDADMYKFAIEFLKKSGYHHYEIFSFARPGRECKHNINYWKNGEYLGFGLGAVSHINGKRIKNTEKLEEYLSDSRRSPIESIGDQPEDFILGLQLVDGIRVNEDIKEKFLDRIHNLKNSGLLTEQENFLKLTSKGILFADYVFRDFMEV